MSSTSPGLYFGTVAHRRLQPVAHHLSYEVASVFVNVDDLASQKLPALLGYNRPNVFSIRDSDHGDATGESIRDFAWRKMREVDGADLVTRIFMLCYPRVLGYGFNPLTTYYGLDAQGRLRLMVYEVHNTFGGRHAYVTQVQDGGGHVQTVAKVLRVSPFNRIEGRYVLRASAPGETLSVGVALSTEQGPVMKAWFHGRRRPLTNAQLLRVFFGLPWMSVKVIAGIHWEALKLWRKGLNLQG